MAMRKQTDGELPEVIKRKANNPKGSPLMGDNGLMLEPGDNSKYLGIGMRLMKLPKIDLRDSVAVEERLEEFFQIHFANDMKPTVSGMGMALSLDRRRLWEIKTGAPSNAREVNDLPPVVVDSIKKAYHLMENLWENYMQNGKINPVSGIFLGKNNFGYQDKTEYVLTPNRQTENDYDADAIRQRYLTDSGNGEEE